MKKREHLSDFEQLTLLSVLRLGSGAYGASIRDDLQRTAGRSVAVATIYVALTRLERNGFAASYRSDPEPVRGGRSRRHFRVTEAGRRALEQERAAMDRMWSGVPEESGP